MMSLMILLRYEYLKLFFVSFRYDASIMYVMVI